MIYINLLIIFIILVFIHEFGHYISARLFGSKVTDFSIGFGKPLLSYTDKNQTNWKISLIPLGGYVKIKGLESIFNNSKINYDQDSFMNLNLFKKVLVLLAGSIFNIFSAWFCLFFLFFYFGFTSFTPEIGKVLNGSPASINDIRKGDIISKINEIDIENFSDIATAIDNTSYVYIDLIRNNKIITKSFELNYDEKLKKYIIGITSTQNPSIIRFAFYKSLSESILFIPKYYYTTFEYLFISINNNTITDELAGPIGIVKMADQLMLDKIKGILVLFIMISLFVGIFNLLPIPLLDGGHILYFILRNIFSESLPNIVTRIYLIIGILIISFLFIFVTLNDIFNK